MQNYLELTSTQVGLAAVLILVNGAISLLLNLGLARSLSLASLRTILQLLLIGLVLNWVFSADRWYVVVGILSFMTLVAGFTALQRARRQFNGMWIATTVSMWVSSWLVTGYALLIVFRGIDYWYQPQYAIPLLGMILGNTLNGISIGLNAFLDSLVSNKAQIEMRLALGATRWEAARSTIQDAIRTGMIPIINAMMIVGIVSLPGMMTGQLLAGADPVQAVRYQIVIMFLIASATSLGTVGVVLLSFRKLVSHEHMLRLDLLRNKKR